MQSTTSGHVGLHPGETLLIRVINTGWYYSEINQTEEDMRSERCCVAIVTSFFQHFTVWGGYQCRNIWLIVYVNTNKKNVTSKRKYRAPNYFFFVFKMPSIQIQTFQNVMFVVQSAWEVPMRKCFWILWWKTTTHKTGTVHKIGLTLRIYQAMLHIQASSKRVYAHWYHVWNQPSANRRLGNSFHSHPVNLCIQPAIKQLKTKQPIIKDCHPSGREEPAAYDMHVVAVG